MPPAAHNSTPQLVVDLVSGGNVWEHVMADIDLRLLFLFRRFGLRFLRLLETQCIWCSNDLLPWRSIVRIAPPLSCFRDFWCKVLKFQSSLCVHPLFIHFINFHWPRPWMTSLPETLTKEIKTVITARQDILQKTMVVKTISKSSGKKQVLEF